MRIRIVIHPAALMFLAILQLQLSAALGATAFTYQGRLADGGQPANGSYDFQFGLYPAGNGGIALGAVTQSPIVVSNGLFTTTLDFGATFNGLSFTPSPSGSLLRCT